jgi:transcriptional regulator with XRE-family HTH domain
MRTPCRRDKMGHVSANTRLREALRCAGMTTEVLAARVGVDPKTAQRWLAEGVTPHPRHQRLAADCLDKAVLDLWDAPAVEPAPNGVSPPGARDEIVAAWAHRAEAPKQAWWELLSAGRARIDLLGYAMQFLPEDHVGLCDLLIDKACRSCGVRIALADPDSAVVAARDVEEGLGGTMPHRIRTTLVHLRALAGRPGIEVRHHSTPMYNSIFRVDDAMFVTPHLFALPGFQAPLLHLRRAYDGGLFDNLVGHFERIWATSVPVGSR